ncbi:MAG: hypothetical protein J3K34DRAFT_462187 [Monoraphidium minutum]|nr:MAG: hypothetical protein J3K34DRAFT_462187 [Monoraphidium minutum]
MILFSPSGRRNRGMLVTGALLLVAFVAAWIFPAAAAAGLPQDGPGGLGQKPNITFKDLERRRAERGLPSVGAARLSMPPALGEAPAGGGHAPVNLKAGAEPGLNLVSRGPIIESFYLGNTIMGCLSEAYLNNTWVEAFVFDESDKELSWCISFNGDMAGCNWQRMQKYAERVCGFNLQWCSPDEVTWATSTLNAVKTGYPVNVDVVINDGAKELSGPYIILTMTRDPAAAYLTSLIEYTVQNLSDDTEVASGIAFFPSDSPSVHTVSDIIRFYKWVEIESGTEVLITMRFEDVCFAFSAFMTKRLVIETTEPGLIVNGGMAEPTSDPIVALNITSIQPNASLMCVGEVPGPCSNWVNLQQTFTYTLASFDGDGVYRFIYVHQALANGTEIGSPLVGEVLFDNVKPRITNFLEDDSMQCTDSTDSTDEIYFWAPLFYIVDNGGSRQEDAPTNGVTGCVTTDDPTGASCQWVDFDVPDYFTDKTRSQPTNPMLYILPPGNGPKTLYAFAKDAAGNIASANGTIVLTSPNVTGSLVLDEGAAVTHQPFVNVKVAPALVGSLMSAEIAFGPNRDGALRSEYIEYDQDGKGFIVPLPKDTANGTKITIYACVAGVVAPPKIPNSEVTLLISRPPSSDQAPQMCVWNSDNFTACAIGGSIKPFASAVPWVLAPGAGERRAYVWLSEAEGRFSTPASATVTVDPKSGLVAVKGGLKVDRDGLVDLTLMAVAQEMCISEKEDAAQCKAWERYAPEKAGFKLSSKQAEHSIYAFFRDAASDTPWRAGPAKVTYDKTAPKMNKKKLAVTAAYSNGTYILSFSVKGATDSASGVDEAGYLVVANSNKKAPKSKCVDGTLLPVMYAGGKGSVAVKVAEDALASHKLRICAKSVSLGRLVWYGAGGAMRKWTSLATSQAVFLTRRRSPRHKTCPKRPARGAAMSLQPLVDSAPGARLGCLPLLPITAHVQAKFCRGMCMVEQAIVQPAAEFVMHMCGYLRHTIQVGARPVLRAASPHPGFPAVCQST